MDLFGVETAFNSQPTQMMGATQFTSSIQDRKAILYLISQRYIPDQIRRPLLYKFNGEFRGIMQQELQRQMGPGGGNRDYANLFAAGQAAQSGIMPAATGQNVYLKPFEEKWTFVLIVDNATQLNPLGLVSNVPTRMLYSGWLTDEPVVTKAFTAGTPVLNPNAILSTTHHITLTSQSFMGANGPIDKVITTGDYDYIDGCVAQNSFRNGETLYSAAPANVVNSIYQDPVDQTIFSVAPSAIAAQSDKSVEIPTELNCPAFHLNELFNGFANALKMQNANISTQDMEIFTGPDVFIGTLASSMQPSRNTTNLQLDPSKPMAMNELMRMFGDNLKVVVVNQPFAAQVDLAGLPDRPTKRNVMTSIISNTLPALLAQFGFAEIAFRYNSYQPVVGGLGSTNGERGVFQLLNYGMLYNAGTGSSPEHAWNNLCTYMKTLLFPIIRSNAGEFDVLVHCSLSGVSLINLQLLDEMIEGGLTETNNLLGGLNSPMLATIKDVQGNAGQLMAIVGDIRATGTPVPDLFTGSMPSPSPIGMPVY